MEIDDDDQLNENENSIKLTKEFRDKIAKKDCRCLSMVEVLAFLKSDEQKKIKNIDNLNVKVTKDYLESFNKFGLNQNNWKEVAYKVKNSFKSNNKEEDKEENKVTDLEETLLIDLTPQKPEEAFYLIPSLSRKLKAEEMRETLGKLNKEMKKN